MGHDPRPLIWVVDDSPTQAAITEKLLGPKFRYERFADGTTAIEQVTSGGALPALILLDWVMPGLSGDEVCRYLRRMPASRELPIIILTASRTDTDDIVCALQSGANDYLSKPFVAAELHARVGTILRAERERKRLAAMNELAASLLHAKSVDRVLDVIANWIVPTFADGCVVSLVQEGVATRTSKDITTQGDDTTNIVKTIPIRDIAQGTVTLVRRHETPALEPRDLEVIETCLEYSALAIEAALRSEHDRATTRFHEEMVGIVGHDLKGPLAAFGLGLELLREEATGDRTTDTVARLMRSSVRMTKIVEQLLDVTRSRIGRGIPVRLETTSLRNAVADVLDEVRMAHKGTTFELHGTDVRGEWDRDRLQQVIANLAHNAVQYGRANGVVRFEITVENGAAHLRVHNENLGEPINDEVLATIFDPFKRGRTGENFQGLGLGLYIVHQIVLAHGGDIKVTSDQSGTAFRVMLPLP